MEKNDKLDLAKSYLESNGITIEELTQFQQGLQEVTESPALRPSEITGVSNNPNLSTTELTAKISSLESRFNNLIATLGVENV